MHDIRTSMRAYYDNIAEPVTADEILTSTAAVRPKAYRPPNWAIAIAVAGGAAIIIGGASFLLGGSDGGSPPATEPPAVATTTTDAPPPVDVTEGQDGLAGQVEDPDPSGDQDGAFDGTVDPIVSDYLQSVYDVAIAPDGSVFIASPIGIAFLDRAGEWTPIDVDGLPEGSGLDDGWPGRRIDMIAIGSDGELWATGTSTSAVDDSEFGGTVDEEWSNARFLTWIALRTCADNACTWQVFTSDDIPELSGGIGDIATAENGVAFFSVGESLLLEFDGTVWVPHPVSTLLSSIGGAESLTPWSSSLALGDDGVVWAGTNGFDVDGRGLHAFDGTSFVRYTTDDGLPGDHTFQVAAGADGAIWVATDVLYDDPSTASPEAAAGIGSYDGTEWTTYTVDDGLISNDAFIAAGPDGTVWAIHSEVPPFGFSRFDGSAWTAYPMDDPVGGFRATVDANGVLWIAAEGDLVSFDGTTPTMFASPFVFP